MPSPKLLVRMLFICSTSSLPELAVIDPTWGADGLAAGAAPEAAAGAAKLEAREAEVAAGLDIGFDETGVDWAR